MARIDHITKWEFKPRFGNGAVSLDIKVYQRSSETGMQHTTLLICDYADSKMVHQHAHEIKRALEAQMLSHVDAVIYIYTRAEGQTDFDEPAKLERLLVNKSLGGAAFVDESNNFEYFEERTDARGGDYERS